MISVCERYARAECTKISRILRISVPTKLLVSDHFEHSINAFVAHNSRTCEEWGDGGGGWKTKPNELKAEKLFKNVTYVVEEHEICLGIFAQLVLRQTIDAENVAGEM